MPDAAMKEHAFALLRQILEPYGERHHVSGDGPTRYGVDLAPESERNPTTWFGGVRLGRGEARRAWDGAPSGGRHTGGRSNLTRTPAPAAVERFA
jgi:hypothetical protein